MFLSKLTFTDSCLHRHAVKHGLPQQRNTTGITEHHRNNGTPQEQLNKTKMAANCEEP